MSVTDYLTAKPFSEYERRLLKVLVDKIEPSDELKFLKSLAGCIVAMLKQRNG